MESSSKKLKKGSKMFVQGVNCKALTFKLSLMIVEERDPIGVQSQSPPNVLLFHDIWSYYHYLIQELGTLEMN